MEYRHIQTGYLWILVLMWMIGVGGLIIALSGDEDAAALWVLAGTFVVVGIAVLWFNRLSVSVGNGDVKVRFGPGWPRRVFATRDIIGFRRVRNKWYYGWGVRRLPSGWMFNVWGLDAVELEFADGKKFTIGTDEPGDLLAALSARTALRAG